MAVALSGSDPDNVRADLLDRHERRPRGRLGRSARAACVAGCPNTDSASVTYTPSPQRDRCGFVHLPRLRRHDELGPGDRVADDQSVEDLPTATGATGSTTTNEDTALGVTVRGTDAETCNLTFNMPATTTQGGTLSATSPMACVAGNPNTDTAGADVHPGGQLQRSRQLQLHGHRRGGRDVCPGHRQPDRRRPSTISRRATGATGSTTTNEDTALGLTLGGTDPETLQPDLHRAGHDDPRHAQRAVGHRLRRGQPQQRHGGRDLHPGRQLQRARQLQLHGHRRIDRDVRRGDRQPDRQPGQRRAHRHRRHGHHHDRQPGRHQPGRQRPRDVRADVQHAGHHGPGRDPQRDQPAGLQWRATRTPTRPA